MQTKAQRKAKDKYDAKTAVRICLKLNNKTDRDILDRLDSVDNKQGYIKELIRQDIKANG